MTSEQSTNGGAAKKAPPRKRSRSNRPYPPTSFEDALQFAKKVFEIGSGRPVRRLTVFDELGKSPDSSASRDKVTSAAKYGLTKGSYAAEQIELTDLGRKAVDPDYSPREQARARIESAINETPLFADMYAYFADKKLPSRNMLIDFCKEKEVPENYREEAVDNFILNLKFVGLLKDLAGAERIISFDAALDDMPAGGSIALPGSVSRAYEPHSRPSGQMITSDDADFETTCFFVTPIGEEGSVERQHADLIGGSFLEPAIEEFGLKLLRADKIDKPGMITKQVIDYIMKSRMVIADLSFNNPNVFYELALRHAIRKPIVQIIRAGDKIPFDINQMRTIVLDLSNVYSSIPKVDLYRAEIRAQVRQAIDQTENFDSPISQYYPSLTVSYG